MYARICAAALHRVEDVRGELKTACVRNVTGQTYEQPETVKKVASTESLQTKIIQFNGL